MIIGICVGIITIIFLGDLWIKNHIEKTIVDFREEKKLGRFFLIRKHHNKGMVLNFGEKKRPIVAALSAVLVLCVLVILILSFGRHGNHLLRVGLALLVGGGFSNTYDRLKRKYVVDYVSFNVKWKGLKKVVFNCSDFCIMIGALLIALGLWR